MNSSSYLKFTATLLTVGVASCVIAPSLDDSSSSLLPETAAEITAILSSDSPEETVVSKQVFTPKQPSRQKKKILNIQFDSDKWEIRPQDYHYLGELGKALQGGGLANAMLEINAYTDSVGDDDYNRRLSQKRAEAVKNFLVSEYGIDGNRLEANGHGEESPLYSNATPAGRAKNRRVEVRRIK